MTQVQNRSNLNPANAEAIDSVKPKPEIQKKPDVFPLSSDLLTTPVLPADTLPTFPMEGVQIFEQMAQDLLDQLVPRNLERGAAEDLSSRLEFVREQVPELHRELTLLREVVRQVREAVLAQGMDMAQALNMLRVDQGGVLFQRLQDFLSKNFVGLREQLLSRMEKMSPEALRSMLGSSEALNQFLQKNQAMGEMQGRNPALAILEMMRGEINPQKPEHFLVALQMMGSELSAENAQKLLSYLKKRGLIAEQDYFRFLHSLKAPEQQRILPEKRESQPVNFWYFIFAALSFGATYWMSKDFVASLMTGLGVAALMFMLNFILKKH